MNYTDYKAYHESCMRNNHGSNAVHTVLCIFFTIQCTLLCAIQEEKNKWIKYTSEYVIIVLPMILAHTVLAEYIYLLNAYIAVILICSIINKRQYIHFGKIGKLKCTNKRLHSISCIRGLTYLITGLCILAVDFKDFPRYLAKTENYGYSLMDTGVGLFVLISGMVHKDLQKNNVLKVMYSNFHLVSILVILGIGRYISIKQLDYHEHVTEYGVHWNFYFTLAVCKLFSSIILVFSDRPLLLSMCTIFAHEFLLLIGLEAWVFSTAPRLSLIDANREGISSNLGYISLYLFGVHLKQLLMNQNKNLVLSKLVKYTIFFIILSYITDLYRPTSRTLANAGYCTFLISIMLILLTVMLSFELNFFKEDKSLFQTPIILSAVNDNGLIHFLICNLSTGLVNMSFQTMLLSSSITFVILNIYMMATLAFIVYLNRRGIKL